MNSFPKDFSLSAATAEFVAVLVGFTSSVAIVFQAATSVQISAWSGRWVGAWACVSRCRHCG